MKRLYDNIYLDRYRSPEAMAFAWLFASIAYEQFYINIMTDAEWDTLTVALNRVWADLPLMMKHAIPKSLLEASTASGLNYNNTIVKMATNDIKRILTDNNLIH